MKAIHGFDYVRRLPTPTGIKKVARDMEKVFMRNLVSEMLPTPQPDPNTGAGGVAENTMRPFLVEAYADAMTQNPGQVARCLEDSLKLQSLPRRAQMSPHTQGVRI